MSMTRNALLHVNFQNGKMVFNQNLNHAFFEGTSLYKFDTLSILYDL